MAYIDIDVAEYLDEVGMQDLAEHINSLDQADIGKLNQYLKVSIYDDVLLRLCRELDMYGLESFLNEFSREVERLGIYQGHIIKQRIETALNKHKELS